MNRLLIIFFIFVSNCSLDTRSGIWTEQKKIEKDSLLRIIFKEEEVLDKELNPSLIIKLDSKLVNNSYLNNNTNNNGRINFDGNLTQRILRQVPSSFEGTCGRSLQVNTRLK